MLDAVKTVGRATEPKPSPTPRPSIAEATSPVSLSPALPRRDPPTPFPSHFSASASARGRRHTLRRFPEGAGEGAMEEDSPALKTAKGALTGLAAGTIWGTIVATWYDVPRVERHVALPGLIRTLKMCGSYGVTFAAVGGLYIGVEQLVESQRKKRDFVNGAIGAFVSGATVYGWRGKSIKSALIGGSALAFTSAALDVGGNTTRVDNGKAYHAYTTEKKPAH